MKIDWAIPVLILVGLFIAGMLVYGLNAINKDIEIAERNLGRKVIIEGDTLMIFDYSLFSETYTLSNGKKINIALAEKLQVVE